MIRLSYPRWGQYGGVICSSNFIGTFYQDGTKGNDVITVRSDLDSLAQARGVYGENAVDHFKIDADVEYSPCVVVPSPTAALPEQVTIQYFDGSVLPKTITAGWGVMRSGCKLVQTYVKNSRGAIHCAYSGSFPCTRIVVYQNPYSPFAYSKIEKWDFISAQPDGNVAYYLTTTKSGKTTLTNLSNPVSYETILGIWESAVSSNNVNTRTFRPTSSWTHFTVTNVGVNPNSILAELRYFIERRLDMEFPLDLVPWGDLTNQASKKVRRVETNMIAFLRDLRDPSSMIPKLRNLRHLKSWTNNYLTVKYGILPTISDIQTIVEAVLNRKPYFDKNGFSTYTGSHFATFDGVDAEFSLEQHAKIAIGEEDSGLDRLISSVESIGLLPDLKSIWDLVPYSFAIDWFVDVGDLLDRVDGRTRLSRYNIRYTTLSFKRTWAFKSEDVDPHFYGPISMVRYHRWVPDQCPVPTLSLDVTPEVSDHWLEAAALTIQRAH